MVALETYLPQKQRMWLIPSIRRKPCMVAMTTHCLLPIVLRKLDAKYELYINEDKPVIKVSLWLPW